MATVYKIVDKTNGKIYVGVTRKQIEERLSQHFYEAHREHRKNRKLYHAINENGKENFTIYKIEDCNDAFRFDRERYWISYYGSFFNGYNDTFGGKGKQLHDYKMIVDFYEQYKNIQKTALVLGIDRLTVKNALTYFNKTIYPDADVIRNVCGKKVDMFDLNGKYQKSFSTLTDAAKSISKSNIGKDIDGIAAHIGQVCSGKRKTAYKHKWAFSNTGA